MKAIFKSILSAIAIVAGLSSCDYSDYEYTEPMPHFKIILTEKEEGVPSKKVESVTIDKAELPNGKKVVAVLLRDSKTYMGEDGDIKWLWKANNSSIAKWDDMYGTLTQGYRNENLLKGMQEGKTSIEIVASVGNYPNAIATLLVPITIIDSMKEWEIKLFYDKGNGFTEVTEETIKPGTNATFKAVLYQNGSPFKNTANLSCSFNWSLTTSKESCDGKASFESATTENEGTNVFTVKDASIASAYSYVLTVTPVFIGSNKPSLDAKEVKLWGSHIR